MPHAAVSPVLSSKPPDMPRLFEDFRVGQVVSGGTPRTFTPEDVDAFARLTGDEAAVHVEHGHTPDGRPLVHGAFALSAFYGWVHEVGLSEGIHAAFDVAWDYHAPIHVGDTVTYEMTITRTRRTSALDRGVVGRHVLVRNQEGAAVQEGTSTALVRARSAIDDRAARAPIDTASPAWARLLAGRLNDSAEFATATGTWDGTVGLGMGRDTVLFRVYRGRVLETPRRTPHGPTFVLSAPDVTWARLLTDTRNTLIERSLRDEFVSSGNAYEYVRLTKAVSVMVDEARALLNGDVDR
jgi:acyl dehydratase